MTGKAHNGVLRWDAEAQQLKVEVQKTGRLRKLKVSHHLTADLAAREPHQLDGLPVRFRWENGQVHRVWSAEQDEEPLLTGTFINPYTFLPATPRTDAPAGLGDGPPAGHDRLHDDHVTGRIRVRLNVVTPLLLLDPSRAEYATPGDDRSHARYPVLHRDGRPHIPATAVKGMLRAAYEAVTNSRLGVFTGHDDRLGTRMPTSESPYMVPARISDDGRDVVLLPGDTAPGAQKAPPRLLHAAWLPRYSGGVPPVTYDGQPPRDGQEVEAWVQRVRHHRWDRRTKKHKHDFDFWRVRVLAPVGSPLPEPPTTAPERPCTPGRSWHEPTGESKRIRGWVCVTNQNINRKHDERVFFSSATRPSVHPLTPALARQWEEVIRDYRAAHRHEDIHGRKDKNGQVVRPDVFLGNEPGRTAWSPHQYEDDRLTLTPGSLCYARWDTNTDTVQGLYPVMISRTLFERSPAQLLDPTLRPAASRDELSPADRVFGWTNPSGRDAERGRVRIGPVDTTDVRVEDFAEEGGVPLAILSAPKPQQRRFYVGAADGDAAAPPRHSGSGQNAAPDYADGWQLRGRKAYWHHRALPPEYWDNPTEDRTQRVDETGRFQEYRRPDEPGGRPRRDTQNRSVEGWIAVGSTCSFTIGVTDLTPVELGALGWLLSLDAPYHHRLGLGKPLGFGSVHLTIDQDGTDLRTGRQWRASYRDLRPEPDRPADAGTALLNDARRLFENAVGPSSAHLEAFRTVSSGGSAPAPVHYPRVRKDKKAGAPPDPDGNNYAWFTANEKIVNRRTADDRGRNLPSWDEQPTLPVYRLEK